MRVQTLLGANPFFALLRFLILQLSKMFEMLSLSARDSILETSLLDLNLREWFLKLIKFLGLDLRSFGGLKKPEGTRTLASVFCFLLVSCAITSITVTYSINCIL